MSTGRLGAGDTAIQPTILDAKGDLIVATAADTPARLAVGSANQVLTVDSSTATGLKWAAIPASTPTFVGCRAFPSSDQTISNNTGTTVNLGNETYDTDGFHSTSTNTSRMTIPSGKNGYYLVIGKIGYFSNTTGARQVRLLKNGTIIEFNSAASAGAGAAGNKTVYSSSAIINCAVGDYIEMAAYQDSGGNLNLDGSSDTTSLTIQFLGA